MATFNVSFNDSAPVGSHFLITLTVNGRWFASCVSTQEAMKLGREQRNPRLRLLDIMIARYLIAHPGALPSKTTVLELAGWLHDNPGEGEEAKAESELTLRQEQI